MIAFILLCVAVLLESAPPLPYARWVAFALALAALILVATGHSHI